ncbi:MAG TPA: MBL fold metallo-hydrolase [Gemmatimonadaceae bacterium]|nr:MBL fold metallo-hydrolase [Gemmatimonadaceae bacterium]
MELEFLGAAREVTGSCHILRVNGRTVLLDCGLFQGRRVASDEKNRTLPVPVDEIDAIVLSHAHIDHSGRLPFLVSRGYDKTIWATPATRDLCAIMLADSAHIQEQDARFYAKRSRQTVFPLYSLRDATRVQELMVGVPYGRTIDVVPGIRVTYVDAGHILGSASVVVDCTEQGTTRRLIFSADIGRYGLPIIRDPHPPSGGDVVLLESTYGDRDHPPVEDMRGALAKVVTETAARGGRVLIPAFAVGRTQEIIYDLHVLAREKRIPPIPIYVDSPLAIDTTAVFELHPDLFDQSEAFIREVNELFRFDLVHYTRDVSESKALNSAQGPMIIIAASGMAEAGRIVHHLANGISDPRNTVLIVGFQAEHTLGRRIVERQPVLRLLGDEQPLRAQVVILNGYSAHADRSELARWLGDVRKASPALGTVYLVHGEAPAQDAFRSQLTADGYTVETPTPRTRVTL